MTLRYHIVLHVFNHDNTNRPAIDGHDQFLCLTIRVTSTQGKLSSGEYVLQCMYHTKVHAHVHTSTEQLLPNREASLRSAVLIITPYPRLAGVSFIMKHMGTRLMVCMSAPAATRESAGTALEQCDHTEQPP